MPYNGHHCNVKQVYGTPHAAAVLGIGTNREKYGESRGTSMVTGVISNLMKSACERIQTIAVPQKQYTQVAQCMHTLKSHLWELVTLSDAAPAAEGSLIMLLHT